MGWKSRSARARCNAWHTNDGALAINGRRMGCIVKTVFGGGSHDSVNVAHGAPEFANDDLREQCASAGITRHTGKKMELTA